MAGGHSATPSQPVPALAFPPGLLVQPQDTSSLWTEMPPKGRALPFRVGERELEKGTTLETRPGLSLHRSGALC